MAEFKLGRIRFVWKNEWTTDTTYYKDDVVSYGGKIYICVLGHDSAPDFFTDLDITPSKWNLVSDGQTWKGEWQPQVRYVYDDIVSYGARLYICQEIHTSAIDSSSGIEGDLDKWKIFAEGLDWRGDWTTSTKYVVNDVVKYGGTTYVCNTAHISAATETLGLEADQSKWDYFNQGLDFKGAWDIDVRYKVNDVVNYGASLWIATGAHTSSSTFGSDNIYWDSLVEGLQYEAEWSPYKGYQPGDIVQYGGNQYVAKTDHINSVPPDLTEDSNTDWDLFSEGLRFLGDWNEDSSNQEYRAGEVVRLGGYTYLCIKDHTNQQPPDAIYWQRLNTGLDWQGEWLDDKEYYEGDVVRLGDNAYVCIKGHISEGDDGSSLGGAAGSRPDLADSGQYWSVIAVGSEQSVLTTKGDLVYYSGSAPTRLPIGKDGQILQVNSNGLPEWAFLGSSADVYYVAENGKDQPAPIYGKNIDRPWKSIRYAAQQIERGTKVPEAAKLLELNRRFIQREITEWTKYQVANAGVGSIWENFDFDTVKCERDMGYIIDAFMWDLTHGGNVRSREVALSYVNETEGSPYLNQKANTVASIQYGISLIEKVLAQEAPDVNYQVTNGDNSTAIVEQSFISDYGRQDNVEYEGIISGTSSGGTFSEVGENSGGAGQGGY